MSKPSPAANRFCLGIGLISVHFHTYRIAEIENQIGAGLIEEVIQVAQDELKLVDEMAKNKVYV